jgi:hypothetical protein
MLNRKFSIQEILSLGYVYLLVLGIFHNSIYYGYLGINILDYSSILDVLLSPISVMLSSKLLFFTVDACIVVCILYTMYMPKFLNWSKKFKRNQTEEKLAKIDKTIESLKSPSTLIYMSALMVFSMFIGLGIGKGYKRSNQIENKELKANHEIIFSDNQMQMVNVIGKNSLNVFYVVEGGNEILISPIEGNIKTIRKTSK